MKLDNQQDFTTLSWVKPELDETLKLARHALEAYVEEGQDQGQMKACVGYLHQVQGTLRMVELYGAAMVAEEMEQLGKAILNAQTADAEGSYAVLMRGIVQLPDYLERLQSGHRDIPIVLLPLLNELRGARGEQGLSEAVLFSPDLSRPLPSSAAGPTHPLSPDELKRRAGGLGALFQPALLQWLKDDGNVAALRDLTGVCDQLVPITHAESARRLFWVAAGTLDALARGTFIAEKAHKQALAKVEREIKRLVDQGDNAFRTDPPVDLTRQLLYFVANAPSSQGRLSEIRNVFGLDELTPSEAELSHARGSMSGHNRALLATVAGAIKEDLMRVKDTLDLHLRSPGAEASALAAQAEALDRVGDTLGMLGLGVPRRVVTEQANQLKAVSVGQKPADEATLLDIAGALLYVEASLDDQVHRLGQGDADDAGGESAMPSAESRAVLETLVKEAAANFGQVRQCFVAFVETHWDHAQLSDVPRLLEEVGGALRILEVAKAPEYLVAIRRFTENELLRRRRVPNGQQMDRLADALASVEYFLEAVRDRRPKRESILDVTESALTALNYWPLSAGDLSEPAMIPSIGPAPPVIAMPALAPKTPVGSVPSDAPELTAATPASAPIQLAPAVEPARVPAAVQQAPTPSVAAPVAVAATGLVPLPGYDASTSDEIDDEIREVFLEEFQEEIGNLDQLLPVWRNAPDSAESLRPIRRVFHTLKGSGRLVGAKALGEFSWKIESMLNRVLDGTRPASPAVLAIVDQTFDTLPLLRAALGGETVYADIEGIGEVADRIAAGEEIFYTPSPLAAVAAGIPSGNDFEAVAPIEARETALIDIPAETIDATPLAPVSVAEESLVEGQDFAIDPVLFEILKPEVAGHLEVVDAWVAGSRMHGPQPISESVLRSLHTMSGAFAMTEVSGITEVLSPLEGYAKRAISHEILPGSVELDTVADAADAVRTTVQGLGQLQPRMPHFPALAERARALRDALPEPKSPTFAAMEEHEAHGLMPQAVVLESPDVSAIPDFADATPALNAVPADEAFAFELPALDAIDPIKPQPESIEVSAFDDAVVETGIAEQVSAEHAFTEMPAVEEVVFDAIVEDTTVAPAIDATANIDEAPLEREVLSLDDFLDETAEPGAPIEVVSTDAVEAAKPSGEPAVSSGLGADDALAAMIAAFGSDIGKADDVVPSDEALAFSDAFDTDDAPVLEVPMQDEQGLPDIEEYYGLSEADLDALTAPESAELAAQAEAARLEQERAAAEQAAEAERLQQERIAAERAEQERVEQTRLAAEQAEAERLEQERLAAERAEQERAGLERLAAERAEAERAARVQQEAEAQARAAERSAAQETSRQAAAAVAAVAATSVPLAQDPEDPDAALDMTDLDAELLDIFMEESTDLLDHSDGLLAGLREDPTDKEIITGLQRDLHTLKGGARMAGIFAVGELGHSMESLLEAAAEDKRELDGTSVVVLERAFDRLHGMVGRIGERKAIALPANLIAQIDALALGKSVEAAGEIAERPAAATALDRAKEAEETAELVPVAPSPRTPSFRVSAPIEGFGEEEDAGVRAPQEMVRIRADLLDRLVNYAGEVAIYRARLEQQLGAFRGNLGELDQTTTRLREQLRRLEIETEAQITSRYQREQDAADPAFDPLELDRFSTQQQLSRALAESANDLTNLQGNLDELTRQYETLLLQQSRVSSDLQEGLMRTRMVPFDALVPRLRRVMRQASADTGKHVQLKVDGAQGEMDRNVLERMTAPLEHMLRNSMAHGIESPEDRRKAGKPEEGSVRIAVSREGSEVVLKISDDGHGLNKTAIRAKAIERGLIDKDAELSDQELYSLILETGFSTAESVSRLAGRGVGMDVVYSEIRQLGGSLNIDSKQGEGSTFTVRLPFTLAVTQAVFVRIGETSFAVPIASVRGISRLGRAELEAQVSGGDAKFKYAGEDYAIHDLGDLIGHGHAKAQDSLQMPLLLARAGDLRAAICIDEVLGSREIVVKPVGPQVNSIPGIFGATIMGDGRVVVILDVAPLVRRRAAQVREEADAPAAPAPAVVEKHRVPTVMVVDDSITMRKVTGRVLERHNLEVLTAKDGVDAIEKLAEHVPDLMLLDIEMPRMDGYELATIMRGDQRLKDVPIMMITSRTGDKHRQRAMEIGVNRYLGKPYQENELMRNVFEMLGLESVNG